MSGATSPEAETIIRQQDTINRLMGQSASRIEQVQRSLDGAYAAQKRFEAAQNSITSAQERGRITQDRANQLLDLARQRYLGASQAAGTFAAANDNAGSSSRRFSGIMGQAGFQVQDFAVQVQGGTSALTAFSQQAPQLAGAFGPGGAIVGAGIAIAGLVAGLLLGKSATDQFAAAMERNRESFERANEAAEKWRDGLRKEAEALADLQSHYRSLSRDRQDYELRNANRDAADVEARRAALQRQVLGGLPGLSQGLRSQISDAETQAARNYGRGSAEFDMIANDETLQRFRELIGVIEGFREVGDVSENAIASLSARLREAAQGAGPLQQLLLRAAQEMEKLGKESRDVTRDTDEVNKRLAALGAQASGAATQVAALAAEMSRLQQTARDAVGTENNAAIATAEARAKALAAGLRAARNFDAQQAQTESADRYFRDQQSADERRLREARLTEDQIREELGRTETARREASNRRAQLEAQNSQRLRELEEREREGRRGGRAAEREARKQERDAERAAKDRDRLIAGLDDEAAANLRLEDTLRRIAEAREKAGLSAERATELEAQARQRRDEEIARLNEKNNKQLDNARDLEAVSRDLGNAFSNAFESAIVSGAKFSDVMKQLEQDIIRLITRALVLKPLESFLGNQVAGFMGSGSTSANFLSSLFGSGATAEVAGVGIEKAATAVVGAVLHEGGIVGQDGPQRVVPAAVFHTAPRYHRGGFAGDMPFAPDEVPAILRRGEMVLTEQQQRAVKGGRSVVVNQNIRTDDPGAFMRSGAQIARDTARGIQRAARIA